MISISLEIDIPDFDKQYIEIQCSICELHTWVKLGYIRRQDFVICRGCYTNLLFEDHLGKIHRILKNLDDTLRSWEF